MKQSEQRHIISAGATLRDALAKINSLSGGDMTLFVVDKTDSLLVAGTLTDGDIRRALLAGHGLDSPVTMAMHVNFRRLTTDSGDNDVDLIRDMRSRGITLVPRVDTDGRLVEIVDLTWRTSALPLRALLMAGGKGERLRPLTLDTPKPLLQIDGKAIIDYNVEALVRAGITDITVSTRYLAEKIHDHFARPFHGVQVRCITEDKPLGTIGAASLIPHDDQGNTLVMNSDLLTTVSFEDMYLRHRDTHADITVGVIPYQISVPYAILTTDGDNVTGIEEKPSYSYYANAGIYIIANNLLSTLKPDTRTDATDLIANAIADGRRVVYHTINGTWIDVGSPTDFRQAAELMRHHRNLSRQ